MREKVLAIFKEYSEGGTIRSARDAHGVNGFDFYRLLRQQPDLKALYHQIQEARADMMYDEAYEISTDESKAPHAARVMAEIRMKIGQAYDRKRFGDKVSVEVDAGPNLHAALEAAKTRVLLPVRDPAQITDAQYVDITQQSSGETTDQQSVAAPYVLPPGVPDPFED